MRRTLPHPKIQNQGVLHQKIPGFDVIDPGLFGFPLLEATK